MKLLYIVNQLNGTTGQERIIALKTNYFIKEFGYHIVIIALNEGGKTPFFEFNSALKKYNLPKTKTSFGYFSKFKEVNKILETENPDVVVVCIDNIIGLYIPHFLNKKFKYVYERHNSKSVNYSQNLNSFATKIINKVKIVLLNNSGKGYDKVVLLSHDHIKEWKYLKTQIEIISNPLIFYPNLYAPLENKRVLAVGRHNHQKGFDYLIESWAEVVKTHKDWKLDIYGKKDGQLKYIKLAEKYDISEYINFYEPVTNIMKVYLESSIYALSSRFEGFPLVLVETMACGVPAVAFNCPCGVKELITNNEDGCLVEVNNTKAFAASLMQLIENPEQRKKMGVQARKNILKLSPDVIFPKWKNMFEALID
ncbi:glycosyltransferase family 4 protein [Confluentibacter flavum]|uniref:Glycosyl transferase family 1 domain-containing protein n=1 Tax=Confluentibacter flavum TaxID=1909700 RepID=A0A2N3HI93_9FLAO|nr:glycosyltransferase family 4 protein [Confluentibacter flavum]PKQ44623.1 hypothetical protein CSW08_12370 [Confluentibacter flavum]